jgi:hypothetical protein
MKFRGAGALALAVGGERPAVVAALELVADHRPEAQAHPPVRALVTERGRGSARGPVDGDLVPGDLEPDRRTAKVAAADDRVPVVDHAHVG